MNARMILALVTVAKNTGKKVIVTETTVSAYYYIDMDRPTHVWRAAIVGGKIIVRHRKNGLGGPLWSKKCEDRILAGVSEILGSQV